MALKPVRRADSNGQQPGQRRQITVFPAQAALGAPARRCGEIAFPPAGGAFEVAPGNVEARGGRINSSEAMPMSGNSLHSSIWHIRTCIVHKDENRPETKSHGIEAERDNQPLDQGDVAQDQRNPVGNIHPPGKVMDGTVNGQILKGDSGRPWDPPEDKLVNSGEEIDEELEPYHKPREGAGQSRVVAPPGHAQAGFRGFPRIRRAYCRQ